MRYAWDLRNQYLRESGLDHGLKGWLTNKVLDRIQRWDKATAGRPDHYIANSHYIADRIQRVWGRDSIVIYPPVAVNDFTLEPDKENYYFAASRMVPYKKMGLIVEAFSAMPDKRLVVIGDGPDLKKVQFKAGKNIELLGYQPFEVLKDYMQRAKALIFAAEEDFGIIPVEAQACGTPVIAYGRGGVTETVVRLQRTEDRGQKTEEKPTGVFFDEQKPEALIQAVREFEHHQDKFDCFEIRKNAERFNKERFKKEFKDFVDEKLMAQRS
jgi:glycosyltransferase involved in cell wall biosynthesis